MDKGLWKMVTIFPQPFFMTYSDGKFPVPVSFRAEERADMGQRLWALLKRRAERSPATMGLPHFGVRFLHSASLSSK